METKKEKIKIPELRVWFLYSDSGYCRDVFRTITGLRICRQDNGRSGRLVPVWYTLSSEDEPECPIKTGHPIHIVGNDGTVVATEHNCKRDDNYCAEKKFPFSWEKSEDRESKEVYDAVYHSTGKIKIVNMTFPFRMIGVFISLFYNGHGDDYPQEDVEEAKRLIRDNHLQALIGINETKDGVVHCTFITRQESSEQSLNQ